MQTSFDNYYREFLAVLDHNSNINRSVKRAKHEDIIYKIYNKATDSISNSYVKEPKSYTWRKNILNAIVLYRHSLSSKEKLKTRNVVLYVAPKSLQVNVHARH